MKYPETIPFRTTSKTKTALEKEAESFGFSQMSNYMRFLLKYRYMITDKLFKKNS